MASNIPIIRAASIAPMVRWMHDRGQDIAPALSEASLQGFQTEDPLTLIPLRGAIAFLRAITRGEPPDTPYRIIDGRGLYEIGLLGSMALGGETPRDVLKRASAAMRFHCSHEFISLTETDTGLIVSHGMHLNNLDAESRHLEHQYSCALIEMVFAMTAHVRPYFVRMTMSPHPEHGLSHLPPTLAETISEGPMLVIEVRDDIADGPLIGKKSIAPPSGYMELNSLQTCGKLSASVALLVEGMMKKNSMSIDLVAASASMSTRTLQRMLATEGISFSEIVEAERKKVFYCALSESQMSLGELASRLGYTDQATLTRAVRRWAGKTPSDVVKSAGV